MVVVEKGEKRQLDDGNSGGNGGDRGKGAILEMIVKTLKKNRLWRHEEIQRRKRQLFLVVVIAIA